MTTKTDAEKALDEREKALDAREKELAEREKTLPEAVAEVEEDLTPSPTQAENDAARLGAGYQTRKVKAR